MTRSILRHALLGAAALSLSTATTVATETIRPANTPAQIANVAKADIVTTAEQAGGFKTFIAAVKAAGLADTLKSRGPYTVFAPNDAAFAKLPKGTVENLLKPENRNQLRELLAAHVLPELITSTDWKGRMGRFDTLSGGLLELDASKTPRIGKSKVIMSDIKTSNGVIHVVDTVLTPRK